MPGGQTMVAFSASAGPLHEGLGGGRLAGPSGRRRRRTGLAAAVAAAVGGISLPAETGGFVNVPPSRSAGRFGAPRGAASSLDMVSQMPPRTAAGGGIVPPPPTPKRGRKRPNPKQQRSGSRTLPLPILDAASPIHDDFGEALNLFEEARRHLPPVSASGASGKRGDGAGRGQHLRDGLAALGAAEDALVPYLTPGGEHLDWAVYYAAKTIVSYLYLERHGGGSKDADPLVLATNLLRTVEANLDPSLLPWKASAGTPVSSHYLRERVYNHLIGAWGRRSKAEASAAGMDRRRGRSARRRAAAKAAKAALAEAEYIVERMAAGDRGLVLPDAKTYGLVLSAYGRAGKTREASDLFRRMEERHERFGPVHPAPGVICHNAVINAHSKAANPMAAMDQLRAMAERGVEADVVSFSSVLDGWARWFQSNTALESDGKAVSDAIAQAEDIMALLEQSKEGPNVVAYNTLLKVYLNGAKLLGKFEGSTSTSLLALTKQASSIFTRMAAAKVYPDNITLSSVIHVAAAATDAITCKRGATGSRKDALEAARIAEDVLLGMQTSFLDKGDARAKPSTKLYNIVVTALGRTLTEEGIVRAHKLILLMEDNMAVNSSLGPNAVTYTAYMKALADACTPEAAKKAEEVLVRMEKMHQEGNNAVQPSLMSFNISLCAWAKIRDISGAKHAERILTRMEARRNTGLSGINPDIVSYATCIDAWAKSSDFEAGVRAQTLLDRMQEETAKLTPNLIVYNSVISAWGASRDPRAGDRALDILDQIDLRQDIEPDHFTFSSVIHALAQQRDPEVSNKTEALLNRMEERGLVPTTLTYNTVMNAVALSGSESAGYKAEAILSHMGRKADVVSFNTAIKAWALSGSHEKAVKAQKLLENMTVDPDLVTFNTLLNACASTPKAANLECDSDARIRAFRIAVRTFQQIQDSQNLAPNDFTYGTMMKTCLTLLPPGQEQTKLLKLFFAECVQNDCLSEAVSNILQSGISTDEYERILKENGLPSES